MAKVKLTEKGRKELKSTLTSFLGNFTHEIPQQWIEILADCLGKVLTNPGVLEEDPFAVVADERQ